MFNIFTYLHQYVCISDPNISLELMIISNNNYGVSRHKYQMFTLFHKILKLSKKMVEEIYTYDFDLAYQTVLSHSMLCRELNSINLNVTIDRKAEINDYYDYLMRLLNETEYQVVIDFDKINKYLDKLLVKELNTLSFEDASVARMYITNNHLMNKYGTISGPVLVTKLNYNNVNMCTGCNFNPSLSLASPKIVSSDTFFMDKYDLGTNSNYGSVEHELRLLNKYEILNAVKYGHIFNGQEMVYRNRYPLPK